MQLYTKHLLQKKLIFRIQLIQILPLYSTIRNNLVGPGRTKIICGIKKLPHTNILVLSLLPPFREKTEKLLELIFKWVKDSWFIFVIPWYFFPFLIKSMSFLYLSVQFLAPCHLTQRIFESFNLKFCDRHYIFLEIEWIVSDSGSIQQTWIFNSEIQAFLSRFLRIVIYITSYRWLTYKHLC